MPDSPPRDLVVVAGASGFVGRSLGAAMAGRYRLRGLSRRDRDGTDGFERFVRCDLLSLEQTVRALVGARFAVYLVHSMLPTSRLTQASFEDLDVLCADNFARAAAKAGVEQIVYLGGLIADEHGALSEHLRSRLEVERVLAGTGVPVTVLRAGIVLGVAGSSYQILSRLVRRLPVMICPRWTQTRTQPVALDDVVALIDFSIGERRCFGRTFDIAAPDVVSYLHLMQRVAARSGRRRWWLKVRYFSPGLSRLWLSLVTGVPRALAKPLVESLRHEMTARDDALAQMAGRTMIDLEEALGRAIEGETPLDVDPFASASRSSPTRSTVTSVQRMALPPGRDAAWAAGQYAAWCGRVMGWFLRVTVGDDGSVTLALRGVGAVMLLLVPEVDAAHDGSRFAYRVAGGALAVPDQSGSFEFRQIPGETTLLTIVRDFEPRLPWWVYRATQAIVHEWIMRAFAHWLRHRP